MADTYIVQGTSSNIQVTGPTTVLDVVIVAATAQPSGVYFEYPVPADTYAKDGEAATIGPIADGVNWLATNPNVEGEATALYLAKVLAPFKAKVTRLARGIPVGSHIEYTDQATLSRAMSGRHPA